MEATDTPQPDEHDKGDDEPATIAELLLRNPRPPAPCRAARCILWVADSYAQRAAPDDAAFSGHHDPPPDWRRPHSSASGDDMHDVDGQEAKAHGTRSGSAAIPGGPPHSHLASANLSTDAWMRLFLLVAASVAAGMSSHALWYLAPWKRNDQFIYVF
jgi:hypothetical protein